MAKGIQRTFACPLERGPTCGLLLSAGTAQSGVWVGELILERKILAAPERLEMLFCRNDLSCCSLLLYCPQFGIFIFYFFNWVRLCKG